MDFSEILSPNAILCGCQIPSRDQVLDGLVEAAALSYGWDDTAQIGAMVRERESKLSTAIGLGIAIPHSRLERLDRVRMAIACLPNGVDFLAPDRKPVHLVVLLFSPVSAPGLHVHALSMVSRLTKDVVDRLVATKTPASLLEVLAEWETRLPRK